MIFPRIRDNLLNHSQFDLQHDGIKELICIADGYPEADVFWIRGSFLIVLLFKIMYLYLSQHQIRDFLYVILHVQYLNLIMKCME
jgi:hypothetical protein